MKKINDWIKLMPKQEKFAWVLFPSAILVVFFILIKGKTGIFLRTTGIFFYSNALFLSLVVVVLLALVIIIYNWRFAGDRNWLYKEISIIVIVAACIVFGVFTTKIITLAPAQRYVLKASYEEEKDNIVDSLNEKHSKELRAVQNLEPELKEKNESLQQTIDSFSTITTVLVKANMRLEKKLASAASTDNVLSDETVKSEPSLVVTSVEKETVKKVKVPTVPKTSMRVKSKKIIPRYCPPKNGGGTMKLHCTKPPL